jgi:hypothetical protein
MHQVNQRATDCVGACHDVGFLMRLQAAIHHDQPRDQALGWHQQVASLRQLQRNTQGALLTSIWRALCCVRDGAYPLAHDTQV